MIRTRSALAPYTTSRLSVCLAAVLGAGMRLAQAETSGPTEAGEATLPPVTVKARVEDGGYLARRSRTATRTELPINEVPQAITVITAEQLRDQHSQTMQEALRYTAGVRSEMYGLDNRGDWFTLRGGSEGSTLLNGLRVPLTGYYGVVRNEPYALEGIEVLRGPSSVLAGQNGPGGVVNMVSKRPQADTLREAELQLGTDSHHQLGLDLAGALNTDASLQYRLVALGRDSGTQVQHAYEKRQFFAPSLTWKPLPGTRFTPYFEYQTDDSGNTNAFLPIAGTLQPGPHGFIPMDLFIGEPAWDHYGGERVRLGYELEHQLDGRWTLRHRLRHDRVQGEMRTMYADWAAGYADSTGTADPAGTYLNRKYFFTDDVGRITNADLLLEGKLDAGITQHKLVVGMDGLQSHNSQKAWDGDGTPLDVYTPVYGSFPLPTLADTPYFTTRVRQLGVFAHDAMKIAQRWSLVGGLRYDRSHTRDDSGTSQTDHAVSKNLGLVYLNDRGVSPYVSYSESFEPSIGTGFDGRAFKPLRGHQLEAGMKWAPADRGVTAAAAVYQLQEKNRLADDPAHVGYSLQLGEVTVNGLELEATVDASAWEWIANYTYMNARQTASSIAGDPHLGKQLASIPRHSGAAWAVHKFQGDAWHGLKAGLGARYIGETSDGVATTHVPAVTLLDLMLAYERGPWRLAFNVNNLADKPYIATCLDRGDCWFGTRRKAVLSAAYRW